MTELSTRNANIRQQILKFTCIVDLAYNGVQSNQIRRNAAKIGHYTARLFFCLPYV